MLNSFETVLGNKRIYCFINSNLYEPYHKRECSSGVSIERACNLSIKIDFNLYTFEHNHTLLEVENVQLFLSNNSSDCSNARSV